MTKLPRHIKKTHDLVFSAQGLSAREQDIFGLMMAHMRPQDWENNTPKYQFTSNEISEWLNLNKRTSVVSQIKPVAKRLISHVIGFETRNSDLSEEFIYYNFFKRCEYKNRKLTLVPNDELKRQYIEYSKGFSLINTHSFISIKNEMAKRLYEFFSRFKVSGKLNPISIDKLRYYLGVIDRNGIVNKGKKCHLDSNYFINNGVKKAVNYLNSHSVVGQELLFSKEEKYLGFSLVRKGRLISHVIFNFKWIYRKNTIENLLEKPFYKMIDENKGFEIQDFSVKNNIEIEDNFVLKKTIKDKELEEINFLTEKKKRILKIEKSRLINSNRLSDKEMIELSELYLEIGDKKRSEKIEFALKKRIDSRKKLENYDRKLLELGRLLNNLEY
ncbi:replication initiation protein (plasmid) [Candidatus Photodesmus blepharus]|uniref:Replication initiation protein n=1 Tax=Candidatus Photodesmus blepharonis TaxID=1179155 RepID=A0A084CNW3_9GAMM|nr:replication initiation protein [Candidatus Photodesmus blepharus]KEY91492.1 replication initiation protein [Candidatus Photodesmus blepharus]